MEALRIGLAIVELKRWSRPLDRQSGRHGEETAPSTQMLRYLRRVDDLTTGKLRWGMLTNGVRWRLYYQGARSVSEQFFELDLAAVLAIPGHDGGLFALPEADRRHWLRVFALVFSRDAFADAERFAHLPSASDRRGEILRRTPKISQIWSSERSSQCLQGRSSPPHRPRPCRKSGKRP